MKWKGKKSEAARSSNLVTGHRFGRKNSYQDNLQEGLAVVWAEESEVELEKVWARGYDIRYQRERDESSEQEMMGE